MDFLTEILSLKRARVERAKSERPLHALRSQAEGVRNSARPHAFRRSLDRGADVNIIAEFKRASPSKGLFREGADAREVAAAYEAGRAAAISVLTEEGRFHGSLDDLHAVRARVGIPVLRKDFIFDEYQVYESAAAGADALLLITAALDDEALVRLCRLTEDSLGMDALVEVHNEQEMRRAQACGGTLIGVNNRDLRSFEVSLDTCVQLAREMPEGTNLVAESGLASGEEIRRLRSLGYSGFLVGEILMRAHEPEKTLRELIAESA